MKTILISALCIFLFLVAGAQHPVKITGTKKVLDIVKLKNGKYAINSAFCRDTSGMIIIKSPEKSVTGRISGTSPGLSSVSVLTHHIVFHFDIGPDQVFCNGQNAMYFDWWNMNWINSTTLEGDMEDGYYDLLVSYLMITNMHPNFVFYKNFHVYKNMDTTILSTSANKMITMNGYDENNDILPFRDQGGDQMGIIFEFPADRLLRSCGFTYTKFPNDYMKFSTVTPDIKISIGKTAVIKDGQYHRYVIAYPVLTGISKDTILGNDPSDYRHFVSVMNSSPAVQDPYFAFSFGIMNNSSITGFRNHFGMAHLSDDYPGNNTDTIQSYSTDIAIDTNVAFFFSGIDHMENDPGHFTPGHLDDIGSWLTYISPDNDRVLTAFGYYPPVSGDYTVPDESRYFIGNTAPFALSWGYNLNSSTGNLIDVYTHFMGQANEMRNIDNSKGTYDIWQGSIHIIHDSLPLAELKYGPPLPGVFSVILNDSNYMLLGVPGYLQSNMTFDLGKQDANSPTLTSFKILKGDTISNELIHGFGASVKFTAGDFEFPPPDYYWIYQGDPEVHLFYKKFSESQWSELAVTAQPAGFDTMMGMLYTADLEQALNQYPDSAWIDIKTELIDSSGNSTVQIIHPAFLVRDAMTGIKPVYNDRSVLIYPDPALDKIHFSMGEDPVVITIYASTGQPVMEVKNSREIDVSGLNSGLYIMRIQNPITGRIFYGKFIR